MHQFTSIAVSTAAVLHSKYKVTELEKCTLSYTLWFCKDFVKNTKTIILAIDKQTAENSKK